MSHNTFGHLFRVTTWGESHGPALGCVVDGCPPGIALTEADVQTWLLIGELQRSAGRRLPCAGPCAPRTCQCSCRPRAPRWLRSSSP